MEPMSIEKLKFETMQYVLRKPRGFDPAKKYPCILFLHGAGTRGTDLGLLLGNPFFTVTERYEDFPFVVIAPQCHEYTWLDLFEQLTRLVKYARALPYVDADRFYCMGNSMGGYGTWLLAESHPEFFAAIVPICGGGICWSTSQLKNVPVWAFHCKGDPIVMLSESEHMVEWTNHFGGSARLTVYPEDKHNAWDATYANPEVFAWLLSHRNARAEALEQNLSGADKFG